ncbi:hypothetical protein EMM73_02160 [Rheinheimera sediminis]|uniref:hypothetical protein n=1 Tax=Rheinheimera sp. YQF-1 TaxID=2499626 RepID=UPI000FDB7F94|nr:hypothetical protein [Rheinheimera sp. YQF-1]RVT48775.1 hypothetical protein EMM73_02160 [Rheinheimera sp. YQF-1]
MQHTDIRQIATELVQLLGPTDWAIGGSFLLQCYGIEPQARDLDLVCTLQRFEEFKTLLSQYAQVVPVSLHPIYRSKGFARFRKNGLELELMAGIQVLKDDGLQAFEFLPEKTSWQQDLPLMQLADWLELYQLFERPKRVKQLQYYLNSNPEVIRSQI